MKGQKLSINPSKRLESILLNWIGSQRFIYNAKVQEDRYFRTFARKSLQHTGQYAPIDQTYSQFKKDAPFLNEIPSQILRNGAYRWREAYSRFFQKFGGRPTFKKRHGRQSVLITNELFRLKQNEHGTWFIELGTNARPIGAIRLHQKFSGIPKMIIISIYAGKWFVSFVTEELDSKGKAIQYPEYTDVLDELKKFNLEELTDAVNGIDRGVAISSCDSKQLISYELASLNNARMEDKERKKKRYQRKLARQVKGSGRYKRTKGKIANLERYRANSRTNKAHQISHRLTADKSTKVIAIEDLNVKGMSASAKGSISKPGKNVKQKAGLNRSILNSGWGELKAYLKYKSFKRGKLLVAVPANYTSQECSQCGTIDKAARLSQPCYACNACGFTINADWNASRVIAKHAAWGIYQHLHSGQELSTNGSEKPKSQTPVELLVSREAIKSYHAKNCEAGNPKLNLQEAS